MPRKDLAEQSTYRRQYYAKNRRSVLRKVSEYYYRNHDANKKKKRDSARLNREKTAEYIKRYSDELKKELLSAYGGQCQCCGENEPRFLQLDHINNDGGKHRKMVGRGSRVMYAWLRRNGFPKEGFRLLCANCNHGRSRNGGICPHKDMASASFRPASEDSR